MRNAHEIPQVNSVYRLSGVFTPFTSDPATDTSPAWSHDGSRIFFSSSRSNTGVELYEKPFDIPAAETLVLSRPGTNHPMDWSRDGKYLLLWKGNPITDLWALRSDDKTEVLIIPRQAAIAAQWPQFSPDGKWIAFQSSSLQPNAGRNEIHIHGPFEPPSVGQTSAKLSPAGGSWVRWARDGKELFYVAPDGTLMTIPMEFDSNGFKAGTPTPLFRAPMNTDTNNYPQQYAVSADGQRFLVLAAPAIDSPIKVILNWKPE
jgi:eukaryotic-like serine/threonine-protein kinase